MKTLAFLCVLLVAFSALADARQLSYHFRRISEQGKRSEVKYHVTPSPYVVLLSMIPQLSGISLDSAFDEFHLAFDQPTDYDFSSWIPNKTILVGDERGLVIDVNGVSQVPILRITDYPVVNPRTREVVVTVTHVTFKECFDRGSVEFHFDDASDFESPAYSHDILRRAFSQNTNGDDESDIVIQDIKDFRTQALSITISAYVGFNYASGSCSKPTIDLSSVYKCSNCYAYISSSVSGSVDWSIVFPTFLSGTFQTTASANANLDIVVQPSASASYKYPTSPSKTTIFTNKVMFTICGVPIIGDFWVTFQLVTSISASGMKFSTGFGYTWSTTRGYYIRAGNGATSKPIYSTSGPTTSYHTPTFSASGTAEAKVAVNMAFVLKVMKILEMSFTTAPYLRAVGEANSNSKVPSFTCPSTYPNKIYVETGITNSLSATAKVEITSILSWSLSIATVSLPSFGPYRVFAKCYNAQLKPQALPGPQLFEDASGCDSSCPHSKEVTLSETLTVNTCEVPARPQGVLCASIEEGNYHPIGAVFTAPSAGRYVFGALDSDYPVFADYRYGSTCCDSTAIQCLGDHRATSTLLLKKGQKVYALLSGAEGQCGNLKFSVTKAPELEYFVDCSPAIGSDSATGDYEHPFATLDKALEAAATNYVSGGVRLNLASNLNTCAYKAPVGGYQIPARLRGEKLTIQNTFPRSNLPLSQVCVDCSTAQDLAKCAKLPGCFDGDCTCVDMESYLFSVAGSSFDTIIEPASADQPIFAFQSGDVNVELISLQFANAEFTGAGAAIQIPAGATITLTDCMFAHNKGSADGVDLSVSGNGARAFMKRVFSYKPISMNGGGAHVVAVNGAEVEARECYVTGATATNGYGGVYKIGDGTVEGAASLYVEEGKYTNNHAKYGGVLAALSLTKDLNLTQVGFYGSQSVEGGSAIYAVAPAHQVIVVGGTFQRNKVPSNNVPGASCIFVGTAASLMMDERPVMSYNQAPVLSVVEGKAKIISIESTNNSVPAGAEHEWTQFGQIMCQRGTLDMDYSNHEINLCWNEKDGTSVDTSLTSNIRCDRCAGCVRCEACGQCGECSAKACTTELMRAACVAAHGANSVCIPQTRTCSNGALDDDSKEAESAYWSTGRIATLVSTTSVAIVLFILTLVWVRENNKCCRACNWFNIGGGHDKKATMDATRFRHASSIAVAPELMDMQLSALENRGGFRRLE